MVRAEQWWRRRWLQIYQQILANFVLKFSNFHYLGNRGQSDINFNDTGKLFDLENPIWCNIHGSVSYISQYISTFRTNISLLTILHKLDRQTGSNIYKVNNKPRFTSDLTRENIIIWHSTCCIYHLDFSAHQADGCSRLQVNDVLNWTLHPCDQYDHCFPAAEHVLSLTRASILHYTSTNTEECLTWRFRIDLGQLWGSSSPVDPSATEEWGWNPNKLT